MNEGAVSLSQLTGILTTKFEGGDNISITAETEDSVQELMKRHASKGYVCEDEHSPGVASI